MNKKDFVDVISDETGLTKKDVDIVLTSFFDNVTKALSNDDKAVISNFGTLEAYRLPPHDIFSPYDGKTIKGVSDVRFKFKASSNLKETIRNAQDNK